MIFLINGGRQMTIRLHVRYQLHGEITPRPKIELANLDYNPKLSLLSWQKFMAYV